MIVMITSDFYAEYEIYKTDDLEAVKRIAKAYANFKEPDPEDLNRVQLIGNEDNIESEPAVKMADKILYIGDFEEPEE